MEVLTIFSILLGIALVVAQYFLSAYSLMSMGRKAGLKVDWMPFIPVVRTLYRLQIVRQPWWKIFFVGGTSIACMTILTIIWALIIGGTATSYSYSFIYLIPVIPNLNLIALLPCLYIVAIIIFTFELEYKTFKAFGFNPYFALATFAAPVASEVMYYIIAFSNQYSYVGLSGTKPTVYNESDNRKRRPFEIDVANKTMPYQEDAPTGTPNATSSIICTAGAYKGGTFPIRDGEELVIGRDSTLSQIVVTSAAKVSRRHCGIRYSALDNRYMVTDYSSNGTLLADGTRLTPMTPTPVPRGTVLIIGDHENQFKLF